MIKFLLVLYFTSEELEDELQDDDECGKIADSYIEKMVEMPVIPRVGEYIELGNAFQVGRVQHNITSHRIEVECYVGLFTGVVAYAADKEGWNLCLRPPGRELFFRRLKEFEDANVQREQ